MTRRMITRTREPIRILRVTMTKTSKDSLPPSDSEMNRKKNHTPIRTLIHIPKVNTACPMTTPIPNQKISRTPPSLIRVWTRLNQTEISMHPKMTMMTTMSHGIRSRGRLLIQWTPASQKQTTKNLQSTVEAQDPANSIKHLTTMVMRNILRRIIRKTTHLFKIRVVLILIMSIRNLSCEERQFEVGEKFLKGGKTPWIDSPILKTSYIQIIYYDI